MKKKYITLLVLLILSTESTYAIHPTSAKIGGEAGTIFDASVVTTGQVGGGATIGKGVSYSGLVGGATNFLEGGTSVVSRLYHGGSMASVGGYQNHLYAVDSATAGGKFNKTLGDISSTIGGFENEVNGFGSAIIGGSNNKTLDISDMATINWGTSGRRFGGQVIIGGIRNTIDENSDSGLIIGGEGNLVSEDSGMVLGGSSNTIDGKNALISGGSGNKIHGESALILGGSDNEIFGKSSVAVGGTGLKITKENVTAIGKYNEDNPNNLLEIGVGTSAARKNAFAITKSGEITIGSNVNFSKNSHLILDGVDKGALVELLDGSENYIDKGGIGYDTLPDTADGKALIQDKNYGIEKSLGVKESAKIGENLYVGGTSDLKGEVTIGTSQGSAELIVHGQATFDEPMKIKVNGKYTYAATADQLAKVAKEITGANPTITSQGVVQVNLGTIKTNQELTQLTATAQAAVHPLAISYGTLTGKIKDSNNHLDDIKKLGLENKQKVEDLIRITTGGGLNQIQTLIKTLVVEPKVNTNIIGLLPSGTTGGTLVQNGNFVVKGNVGIDGDAKFDGSLIINDGKTPDEATTLNQLLQASNQITGAKQTAANFVDSKTGVITTGIDDKNIWSNQKLTNQSNTNIQQMKDNAANIVINNDLIKQNKIDMGLLDAKITSNGAAISANTKNRATNEAKITKSSNDIQDINNILDGNKKSLEDLFKIQNSLPATEVQLMSLSDEITGMTAIKDPLTGKIISGIDDTKELAWTNQKLTKQLAPLVSTGGTIATIETTVNSLTTINNPLTVVNSSGQQLLPAGATGDTLVEKNNFAVMGDFAVNGNTQLNGTLVIQAGKENNQAMTVGQTLDSYSAMTGMTATVDPLTGKIITGIDDTKNSAWTNKKITENLATLITTGGTLDKMVTTGDTTTLNNSFAINGDLTVDGDTKLNGMVTIRNGRSVNEAASIDQLMKVSNQISGMTSTIDGTTGKITTGIDDTKDLAWTNKKLTSLVASDKKDVTELKNKVEGYHTAVINKTGKVDPNEVRKIVEGLTKENNNLATTALKNSEIAKEEAVKANKTATTNKKSIANNTQKINSLKSSIKRKGAMANALAASTGMSVSNLEVGEMGIGAGYGNSGSASAIGISLGFKHSEKVSATVGISGTAGSNSDFSGNAGVGYKIKLFN